MLRSLIARPEQRSNFIATSNDRFPPKGSEEERKWNPCFSGKSGLVKYYNLATWLFRVYRELYFPGISGLYCFFHFQIETWVEDTSFFLVGG